MKPGIFFYAGKAHVSLCADGELLVSHAFNANDFWEVVRDARIYWPRFVRVPMRLRPTALKLFHSLLQG